VRPLALALAVLALAAPLATAGLGGDLAEADAPEPSPAEDPRLGQRVYALAMEGHRFNGHTWPDTPLLEAYAGETMRFAIHVPADAEMHTFHLHGHPWEDPGTGDVIDTVLLDPGDAHTFEATAGLGEGHTGDWLYHCHVGSHFEEGMWGLLRVYPYAVHVDGPLDGLEVDLTQQGEALEGATFDALLRDEAGDPGASEATQGDPVEVAWDELGDGRYRVTPELPAGAEGELVLRAHHDEGTSLARLDLDAEGGYELDRHVGLDGDTAADPAPGAELGLG